MDSAIKKEDGLRILATRSPGRGVKKAWYDIWMPNLGPSTELLEKYRDEKITWEEYIVQYRIEMLEESTDKFDKKNKHKNKGQFYTLRLLRRLSRRIDVTLICHCGEEEKHCHRHILRELILECEN